MAAANLSETEQFHRERAVVHQAAIRQALMAQGYADLPRPRLQPDQAAAQPVVLVTGANVEPLDAAKHLATPTKSIRQVGNTGFILNQAAAFLQAHLENSQAQIVAQVRPDRAAAVAQAFSTHPARDRLHLVPVETGGRPLVQAFYRAAAQIAARQPVSRLDIVPYESFAAGLAQPFRPIYAETADNVIAAAAKRARMFHQMAMVAYDVLANTEQKELRVVAMTALAARRVGGNLLADAMHKLVSTNYIETLAREGQFHFPDRRLATVEVAPGIVDNGIYDSQPARVATLERAAINGFPFDNVAALTRSIDGLPKINPMDIGLVASRYLTAPFGAPIHETLPPHVRELAYGGRSRADFLKAAQESADRAPGHVQLRATLPNWCAVPGMELGRIAPLRPGYQFVPLCPPGQYF